MENQSLFLCGMLLTHNFNDKTSFVSLLDESEDKEPDGNLAQAHASDEHDHHDVHPAHQALIFTRNSDILDVVACPVGRGASKADHGPDTGNLGRSKRSGFGCCKLFSMGKADKIGNMY